MSVLRVFFWMLFNGLILALFLIGVHLSSTAASVFKWGSLIYVGINLVNAVRPSHREVCQELGTSVPLWFESLTGLLFVALLLYYNWFGFAVLWTTNVVLQILIYKGSK